ncbi:MAG TPA: tRNA (N(6)-L-threonylcarbamoyladenosine(37)-C(2))-methylthiotransferase MtaB [Puia sp.]|nr:tRNA (N(6)-L-threonylcarbamoyladenosine(37)-C(2))-methylthiotransferase MtaB [Puia sp.]
MNAAPSNKTVAFHTLGCKLNFSETSGISRLLENQGFVKKDFDEVADVYVINTCSVTDNADKECRYLVRKIRRQAPDSSVVIMGCYAQLKPAEIAAIPGVDLVLGAAEKFDLARHLLSLVPDDAARKGPAKICSCDISEVTGFHPSWSLGDRTRTFLKVQDGCDYNCSFCTIPMARGASRSDSIAGTVGTVKELAARGDVREIVLTGVNLGDFGKGPGGAGTDETFFHLIQVLDNIEGIDRYRISSIEPNLLTPEMIDWVAASRRFMPHFHIPLQSGSNRILGAMRRRYKRELYAERVRRIKSVMPHCAIGVDVIVGFPGETDELFRETVDFLLELDISYLHVFTYSERDKTKALELSPVIPIAVRNERNKFLRNLSHRKMQDFIRRHEGQTRKVLLEGHVKTAMMEGYTDNYIKVTTPYREEWVNRILDWTL